MLLAKFILKSNMIHALTYNLYVSLYIGEYVTAG